MANGHNDPAYFGNLCLVALRFYLATGQPGELELAYWYARYAARSARELDIMLKAVR
jgi:hypothetical protein